MGKNNRTTFLRIVLSIVVATMLIPGIGIVSADDDWPSKCNKSTPIIETGTYSGSLSPSDQDAFRVALDKGDYANIHLLYSPPRMNSQTTEVQTTEASARDSPLYIHWAGNTEVSFTSKTGGELHDPPRVNINHRRGFLLYSKDIEFRAYSEGKGPMCIMIESGRDTAGEWRMALAINDVQPPKVGAEAIKSQQQLEQRVNRLEKRVAELESQVEAMNSPRSLANNSTSSVNRRSPLP